MSNIITEGQGNVPGHPVMIVPNRTDLNVVHALEQTLGSNSICWLVEESHRPDAEVAHYLNKPGTRGFLCSASRMSKEQLAEHIRQALEHRMHVVLLSGRPGQQPGSLGDVPSTILTMLDDTPLPALPVYAGMYNDDISAAITTAAPYDTLRVQFMPMLKAGAAMGARIMSSWTEAAASQFAQHPLLQKANLAHTLLHSLMKHQNSTIIDGVDDSQLSYGKLLLLALILSRRIRKHTNTSRMGIILPPGKLSIIANVACLLAGVTPVNINYTVNAATFSNQRERAGISRFITEQRFILKQQQFAWPRQRDLLFIDRELNTLSANRLRALRALMQVLSPERIAKWLNLPDNTAQEDAGVLFSNSIGCVAKGVAHTNSMLIAGVLQLQSRLQFAPRERVLCTAPLFTPIGLVAGLLLPLICGCDMVTYPDPNVPKRICQLAHNYGVAMACFTPAQVQHLLQHAVPATFASTRYMLVSEEKLPAELARRAKAELNLNLLEAYSLSEAAGAVALCLPPPAAAPGTQHCIPAGKVGSVGAPLPGIAVRITDTTRDDVLLPPSSLGCVWLQGPAVTSGYLANKPDAAKCMRGKWFRTDDVGMLDADGMLTICGRRERFSKIDGKMVSHVMVEEALRSVLKTNPADERRPLAIVGVPGPSGERLVMLSTLHKVVNAHDALTVRYALTNAHYPSYWAPEKIIAVSAIPTLPNGKLDYARCYHGVCQTLGIYPK
ncbi:MAG: AMP-binding protein [Akkermansia sp.]|nr:AMP-binding protein [Akkermansia sp.]